VFDAAEGVGVMVSVAPFEVIVVGERDEVVTAAATVFDCAGIDVAVVPCVSSITASVD
jgi:hypothetical protein